MNKVEDKIISDAWQKGYDDFLVSGLNAKCAYAANNKRFKYWIMGFQDAFAAHRKHPDELEIS